MGTSSQHILFLDDEQMLVDLARRFLAKWGYRMTGFTSARAAIEAFRREPEQFNWVVTDMNMPECSGLQVTRELRAIRPHIPIILCSGALSLEMTEEAKQIGIDELLYKPTRMSEFCESLHRCFAKSGRRVKSRVRNL